MRHTRGRNESSSLLTFIPWNIKIILPLSFLPDSYTSFLMQSTLTSVNGFISITWMCWCWFRVLCTGYEALESVRKLKGKYEATLLKKKTIICAADSNSIPFFHQNGRMELLPRGFSSIEIAFFPNFSVGHTLELAECRCPMEKVAKKATSMQTEQRGSVVDLKILHTFEIFINLLIFLKVCNKQENCINLGNSW